MGILGPIIRICRKVTLEVLNTLTQLLTALVTAAALLLLVYQTFLQEETSNRSWAADRLAVIYSQEPQAPKYVRQEAVKAFVWPGFAAYAVLFAVIWGGWKLDLE